MSEPTEKQPKSGAERQQSYHQRMKDRGLTRLSAWIPQDEDAKIEFWEAVTELEQKWQARGLPTMAT